MFEKVSAEGRRRRSNNRVATLKLSQAKSLEKCKSPGFVTERPSEQRVVPRVEEKVSCEQLEQDARQAPHVRAGVIPHASDDL